MIALLTVVVQNQVGSLGYSKTGLFKAAITDRSKYLFLKYDMSNSPFQLSILYISASFEGYFPNIISITLLHSIADDIWPFGFRFAWLSVCIRSLHKTRDSFSGL